jgi:ATP-binding cassette subfamily F protein uup
MDTLDMLEEILVNYTGTLFVVSHDRDFLDQVVTKVLAFEGDGKVEGYIGGYSDYVIARDNAEKRKNKVSADKADEKTKTKNAAPVIEASSSEPVKRKEKLSFKIQFELDNLPQKIADLEEEITSLSNKMKDADFYSRDPEGFMDATKALDKAELRLERAENRWLELDEM